MKLIALILSEPYVKNIPHFLKLCKTLGIDKSFTLKPFQGRLGFRVLVLVVKNGKSSESLELMGILRKLIREHKFKFDCETEIQSITQKKVVCFSFKALAGRFAPPEIFRHKVLTADKFKTKEIQVWEGVKDAEFNAIKSMNSVEQFAFERAFNILRKKNIFRVKYLGIVNAAQKENDFDSIDLCLLKTKKMPPGRYFVGDVGLLSPEITQKWHERFRSSDGYYIVKKGNNNFGNVLILETPWFTRAKVNQSIVYRGTNGKWYRCRLWLSSKNGCKGNLMIASLNIVKKIDVSGVLHHFKHEVIGSAVASEFHIKTKNSTLLLKPFKQ